MYYINYRSATFAHYNSDLLNTAITVILRYDSHDSLNFNFLEGGRDL